MNFKVTKPVIIFSSSFIASSVLGYGAYNILMDSAKKEDFKIDYTTERAVCYIGSSYFTNLDKALDVAYNNGSNDTIYVIPGLGFDLNIYKSHTIEVGDVFCLPYDGTTYKIDINNMKTEDNADFLNNYTNDTFADNNATLYRKTNVILNGTSTTPTVLTNYGTIQVGGILGLAKSGSYQKPSGHTVNNYAQINLNSYSSIENNGSIECRGFIKNIINDDSTCFINNNSGSIITMPLVIYDYRGGSYSAVCNAKNTFPFNVFDLPNVQSMTNYFSGSYLKCLIHVVANSQVYAPEAFNLLASSGALFNISSGLVSFKYNSANFPITKNETFKTSVSSSLNSDNINIYGNVGLSSMTISLAKQSINTAEFILPFSYKFNINIKDGGVVDLGEKFKFLSGSKLKVEPGGVLNSNSSLLFYNVYNGHNSTADVYPGSLGSAKFINNGIVNLNGAFAGSITSENNSSLINTGSSYTSNINTIEVLSGYREKKFYIKGNFVEINANANLKVSDSESVDASSDNLTSSNTYTSKSKNNDYYWLGSKAGGTTTEIEGSVENYSDTCLASGTLITLFDGTKKKIEDIKIGDKLLCFDHVKGTITCSDSIILIKTYEKCDCIKLLFDLTEIDIINGHGLFDLDMNKYVNIKTDNASEFINHNFVLIDKYNHLIKTKLLKFSHQIKNAYKLDTVSNGYLNYFANNLLSITHVLVDVINTFTFGNNLIYDAKLMKEDIEKYGLYGYKERENVISQKNFDSYNIPVMKVGISKGLYSRNYIEYLISFYVDDKEKQVL